jgi:hypothetical protein
MCVMISIMHVSFYLHSDMIRMCFASFRSAMHRNQQSVPSSFSEEAQKEARSVHLSGRIAAAAERVLSGPGRPFAANDCF